MDEAEMRRCSRNFYDISRLGPLGTVDDLKFYGVAFLQGSVAVARNSRKVDKDIGTVITTDEAVSFGIVEPLYPALHLALAYSGQLGGSAAGFAASQPTVATNYTRGGPFPSYASEDVKISQRNQQIFVSY